MLSLMFPVMLPLGISDEPGNLGLANPCLIENSEPNFRKGSKAEIQTETLSQSTG